jgi:hypothetical protein
LLEGVPLLKFIIEHGQAIPSLAKFIQETRDAELAKQYIELLSELNIDSSKTYTSGDAEFKVLKLVSNHIIDDTPILDSFREKIILDGVKLLEKAVSADVRMFDADNKFIYQFQGDAEFKVLKLVSNHIIDDTPILDSFSAYNGKLFFKDYSRWCQTS